MRQTKTDRVGRRFRAVATIIAVLGAPALLGACAATDNKLAGFFAGDSDKANDIPAEFFQKPAYCPPVRIRGGTEIYTLYERGHEEEPSFVRYQATITKTARECAKTVDGFTVKIGAGGRAVAGPKGGQASLTLPIRVVVTQQSGGVVFSELRNIPVNMAPPALGADFSHVETIPVKALPEERDFIIYVGFDEGKTG